MSGDEMRVLITAYIDDECSQEEKRIVEKQLESDESLRKLYEQEKQVKDLLRNRLKRYSAPAHLKDKVQDLISEDESLNSKFSFSPLPGGEEKQESTRQTPHKPSFSKYSSYKPLTEHRAYTYILSVAAILLLFLGYGYFKVQDTGTQNSEILEESVYRHFSTHNAQLIEPSIPSGSRSETQKLLASKYNLDIVIPAIKDTEFKGVVYSDFHGGMKTPLLEYYCNNSKEMIYVYAFKVDDIKAVKGLQRDHTAKDKCREKKDYHISNYNGKQVVSWKWDNIWYTAISNQKGSLLASRVDPLN